MALVGRWAFADGFEQQGELADMCSLPELNGFGPSLDDTAELSPWRKASKEMTCGEAEIGTSGVNHVQYCDWEALATGQLESSSVFEDFNIPEQLPNLELGTSDVHLASELDQWLERNCSTQNEQSQEAETAVVPPVEALGTESCSHFAAPTEIDRQDSWPEMQGSASDTLDIEKEFTSLQPGQTLHREGEESSAVESSTWRAVSLDEDSCGESRISRRLNKGWAIELSVAPTPPCNPLGAYMDIIEKESDAPARSLEIVQMSSSKLDSSKEVVRWEANKAVQGHHEETLCCDASDMPKFDFQIPKMSSASEILHPRKAAGGSKFPVKVNANVLRGDRPADMSARLAALVAATTKKHTVKMPASGSSGSSADVFPGLPTNVTRQRISDGQSVDGMLRDVSPSIRTRKGLSKGAAGVPVLGSLSNPMADAALLFDPKEGCGSNRMPEQLLRKQLIAFAEAVAMDDQPRVRFLMRVLQDAANDSGDALQRLAYYFMDALWVRSTASGAQRFNSLPNESPKEIRKSMELFFDLLPYVEFSTEILNNAIFEAVAGQKAVHIVDFGVWQAGQWPSLMERLAKQSGGPPSLRVTAVECPGGTPGKDVKKLSPATIGAHLSKAAAKLGIPFEYQMVEFALDRLSPSLFGVREGEALAFSCCLRLRTLYDATVVRSNPRDLVLQHIRMLNPCIVAVSEMDVDTNGYFFMARFKEAMDYYASVIESMDAAFPGGSASLRVTERNIFAREIVNVVACEGLQRVCRCERVEQWRARMLKAGFHPLSFSSQTVEALQRLLERSPKGFSLQGRNGALTLDWKDRSMLFATAWKTGL